MKLIYQTINCFIEHVITHQIQKCFRQLLAISKSQPLRSGHHDLHSSAERGLPAKIDRTQYECLSFDIVCIFSDQFMFKQSRACFYTNCYTLFDKRANRVKGHVDIKNRH